MADAGDGNRIMNTNSTSGSRNTLDPFRIRAFAVIGGIVILIFIVRLFSIQILQAQEWESQALENRTEQISIPTLRGVIFDRNGIILARNVAAYNLAITPALLPDDPGEVEEIIRQLSEFTTTPISRGSADDPLLPCGDNLGIRQMVEIGTSFAPFQPVLIECDIDRERAIAIQEKAVDWPGVSVEIEAVRDYPTGELTASLIGFLGPIPANLEQYYSDLGFVPQRDKVGYAGLELFFDDILRGTNGTRVVEVDVAGQVLQDLEAPLTPVPGLNVELTIDTRFQQAVDGILKSEINFWNTYFNTLRISSGVVIAMNPKTGEILAMVSYPTYQNNRLARFIPTYYYEQLIADATQPLLNKAVGAELPAGSVFKLVTGVAALNEGVVEPDQLIEAPPKIVVTEKYYANDPGTGREFVDWNEAGFGFLDFIGGLSNSSNVYFYKLGGGFQNEVPQGVGICRLGTYANALGYGSELGIELPEEADGLIPDPTWKRINQGENWSNGDTYIASVGQGYVIATPLQILMSAATIANDGVQMRPTLVRRVLDGEGNVIPIVYDTHGNLLNATLDDEGNLVGAAMDAEGNIVDDPITVSPFTPDVRWDITVDPLIEKYENPEGIGSCKETGEVVTVQDWVIDIVQEGMRRAVTSGTLDDIFEGFTIPAGGKTGTAEYCDATALANNRCIYGNWPTHSWTLAYAPFDDPEIVVIAFLYNGGEGASVAGPVVRQVLEAYFELKAADAALGIP